MKLGYTIIPTKQKYRQNSGQRNCEKTATFAEKILFHQDNASFHTYAVAIAKIHELQFERLDHPPYSPYLATSDFFLFLNLKIALGGQRFSLNQEAIT